jgi:hypothetical protein
VPLAPRFEVPSDRVEEPGFARGPFMDRRPAEETRAQLAYYGCVPLAHLVLEESRQQRHWAPATSIIRLSRSRVVSDTKWSKTVLRFAGAGHSTSACGIPSIVRQHTGVIKQLFSIDGGLGNVPKAQRELQYVPMVGREQFPHWIHATSR